MPILTRRPVPPKQRDQDGPVREELREGHGLIDAIRGLDDDRLIGAAAQDQHTSGLGQRAQRPGEGLSLGGVSGAAILRARRR